MNIKCVIPLIACCLNTSLADFTNSTVSSHPVLPNDALFVIDLKGDWPTDCHPGEQKPVIRQYTGDAVLIEFEIIVEHVTCNDIATPYRVLVDMSDVIPDAMSPGNGTELDVTVRFDNAELNTSILLSCALISPCPYSRASIPDVYPEPGLYGSMSLEKQGLLLARQQGALAAYPLVYDESGSSEWLFGGGQIIQDADTLCAQCDQPPVQWLNPLPGRCAAEGPVVHWPRRARHSQWEHV